MKKLFMKKNTSKIEILCFVAVWKIITHFHNFPCNAVHIHICENHILIIKVRLLVLLYVL